MSSLDSSHSEEHGHLLLMNNILAVSISAGYQRCDLAALLQPRDGSELFVAPDCPLPGLGLPWRGEKELPESSQG